jgi:hypothetical protein
MTRRSTRLVLIGALAAAAAGSSAGTGMTATPLRWLLLVTTMILAAMVTMSPDAISAAGPSKKILQVAHHVRQR